MCGSDFLIYVETTNVSGMLQFNCSCLDPNANVWLRYRIAILYSLTDNVFDKVCSSFDSCFGSNRAAVSPKYRGLCAYFWITAHNESKGGVTAIFIEERLDTGKIVLQREYAIGQNDSMQKVYFNNAKLMAEMICEVQKLMDKNQIRAYKQKQVGESYYSWPNKEGYALFKKHQRNFFKFNELWSSI